MIHDPEIVDLFGSAEAAQDAFERDYANAVKLMTESMKLLDEQSIINHVMEMDFLLASELIYSGAGLKVDPALTTAIVALVVQKLLHV